MPTLYDICDNVRVVRLGLSGLRAQAPHDGAILGQVCSQIRIIKRHRRVTGNPWDFNDLTISVQPNIAVYPINSTDFVQPLSVLTHDPSNPNWVPRLVKIYEPQNLFNDIPAMPNQYASFGFLPWDGSNCTAQRVAFYWRDNIPYAEFWPLPQLSAQYSVRYLQNAESTTTAPLTSIPLPVEDADLVELRSAIALLPLAQWYDESTKENRLYNREQRKDLAVTLANDERMAAELFSIAVRQPTGPRTYPRWNNITG